MGKKDDGVFSHAARSFARRRSGLCGWSKRHLRVLRPGLHRRRRRDGQLRPARRSGEWRRKVVTATRAEVAEAAGAISSLTEN